MNKNFIPQAYAIILYDMGFREECFDSFLCCNKDGDIQDNILLPTWQQAFEWFRTEYSLDNACMKDRFMVERNGKFPGYYKADSYEDAKQKCLIKLIKIVSNGKFNR